MKKYFALISVSILLALLSIPNRVTATDGTPKDSLFNLQSKWSNQLGKRLQMSDLAGQPTLITMAYTGCEYTCPLIVEKLRAIEAETKKLGSVKYRNVIVSFDPKGDRPDKLAAFMKKRKIQDPHWSMLVADDSASTRELAIILGINYKAEAGGHFSHSNVITLLDAEGRIVQQLKGLNADHTPLVNQLVKSYGHGK